MTSSAFNNKIVYIFKMVNECDLDSLDPVEEWEMVSEVMADIQPYSGGKAQEQYGLNIECNMKMFTDPFNIAENMGVSLDDSQSPEYDVMYKEHWDNHTMCLLKKRWNYANKRD